MEVDVNCQGPLAKLSKKQYGFKRGSSTIAAVFKPVKKLEFAILNQEMALDNVSFGAIKRALTATDNCDSKEVNQWIKLMIHNKNTAVELQGKKIVKAIRKGYLQGNSLPFPVEP